VVVTAEDVARLGPRALVVSRPDLAPWHVGVLEQTPSGDCAYLRPDGCSVYDRRPDVCRSFGAVECDRYAPDPEKLAGRVRLRLLRP